MRTESRAAAPPGTSATEKPVTSSDSASIPFERMGKLRELIAIRDQIESLRRRALELSQELRIEVDDYDALRDAERDS